MVNNHKYAPWRRAVLVPFWVLQTLCMIIIIGLMSFAIGVLTKYYDENDIYFGSSGTVIDSASVRNATKIVGPVWIGLSGFCLILTITEIVMLTRRKLTPLKFLVFNVIKSTIWTVLFVIDIIAWAGGSNRRESAIGVVIELGLVLSFWIPLIYSSIIYHRARKGRGIYNPVSNPTGFTQQRNDLENVPYPSQTTGVTGTGYGNQARYEHYKPGGDPHAPLHNPNANMTSPQVPQVYVQHHDNVYEMDNARRTLN